MDIHVLYFKRRREKQRDLPLQNYSVNFNLTWYKPYFIFASQSFSVHCAPLLSKNNYPWVIGFQRKWAHKTEFLEERWHITKAEKLYTIHTRFQMLFV